MTRAIILLAAGVMLGLLLAPEKGTEMRKKLMGRLDDAADDTKDYLNDAASNLKASGKHLATDAQNVAEKMA